MKTALTLLSNDLKGVRSWFGSQTISKLVVAAAFALIISGVFWVLYASSRFFFLTLVPLKSYGWLTADYILRAATVTIFWLGLGSSLVTNLNIFYGSDRNLQNLLSLPVKIADLLWWMLFKTVVVNSAIFVIFLLPILLALGSAFWGRPDLWYLVRVAGVLAATAIITNCGGGITALLLPLPGGKRNYLITTAGVAGFLILMLALIRLVFPPHLIGMYRADNNQFFTIYNSLPLANNLIPTNWITTAVTQGSFWAIAATVILTAATGGTWFYLARKKFLTRWQWAFANTTAPQTAGNIKAINWYGKNPLVLKDILSIFRSPGEMGYGLFLLTILVFFFGLFSQIKIMEQIDAKWLLNLSIFSYLWLLFFVNTYLLRLVFPLTAKEAESAWYMFTLPVKRTAMLFSKLVSALLLAAPLLIFSLTIWWVLPFITRGQIVLMASSTWTIIVLAGVHTFMGAINPNFAEGGSPEKVSTSMMGLVTLAVASGMAVILARTNYGYMAGGLSITSVVLIHTAVSLIFLVPLYLAARSQLPRYQF